MLTVKVTALALLATGVASSPWLPRSLVERQANSNTTTSPGPGDNEPSTQFINYTQYFGNPGPVTVSLSIDGGGRNKTSDLLYGWMFEDISHSGDGGIYAELLVNRAFQGSGELANGDPENPTDEYGPVLTGWEGIGDVSISLATDEPLSAALPTVLKIDVAAGATGEVGVRNLGWWGMDVRPQTYNASFYMKAAGATKARRGMKPDSGKYNGANSDWGNAAAGQQELNLTASIRSKLDSTVWVSSPLPGSLTSDYQQFATELVNQATATNVNNTFAITFDGAAAAGSTFYLGLASLFPETFKGSTVIRADLGQAVQDLAKFFRFPGGNNLEGQTIPQRWKWNETIGPLINRPGRFGDWGYYNTDGLGLMEFLDFIEAAGIQPILGVYAGYSLDHSSVPEDEMGWVLQDILNEFEFIMGDVSTYWGSKRAEYGHPEPYELHMVEIGNEDWFSETYPYRFPYLYNGIKQAYPDLTIISTAFDENKNYTIDIPSGALWDKHDYQTPSYFLEHFNYFDNWQEETAPNSNVTIFIGESSVFQYDTPSGYVNFSRPEGLHISYPNLMSAIGEGVYLLAAERNPNTVKLSTYAPSFANLNWENWTPNLISFTANPDETVKSASYVMETLFSQNHGFETLPITTVEGDFNPLWWGASIDQAGTTAYFKVINSGNSSIPLTLNTDRGLKSASGSTIQAASLQSYNYVGQEDVVAKPIGDLPAPNGQSFEWDVPAWSVNVLQFGL